jgi:hypothetical protein
MTTKLAFRYKPFHGTPDPELLHRVQRSGGVTLLQQTPYMIALEGEPEALNACARLLGPDWGSSPITDATFTLPAPPFANVTYHPDATPETIQHHQRAIASWPAPPPMAGEPVVSVGQHLQPPDEEPLAIRRAAPRSPDLRPARQALPTPRRRPLDLPGLLKTSASSHHKTLPLEASGPKVAQLQVKVALANGPQGPRLLLSWSAPTRPAHGWLLCLYLPDDDEPLFQRVFPAQHPSADLSQDHIGADLNTTDLRLALWPLSAPLPPA